MLLYFYNPIAIKLAFIKHKLDYLVQLVWEPIFIYFCDKANNRFSNGINKTGKHMIHVNKTAHKGPTFVFVPVLIVSVFSVHYVSVVGTLLCVQTEQSRVDKR